ncbi:MAG: ATP-binding protein [Candidatus Krumholzibacteriaceae bacterium]|jgi:signal transduction histidine kinase
MEESLKIRLLKAVGNESVMRSILANMMERTQAEFCAFHTARDRELAYVMIESRELSPRIPELREKLQNSYRMFTNGHASPEGEPLERIYCRRTGANLAYLVSNSKIESYFLVPVTFASKVRGVLFFGSIRKEAFSKNDIAIFRSLADEGEDSAPLVFRVGGDREILDRLLNAVPSGAALVSPDGRIVSANRSFAAILDLNGELPDSVYGIGNVSCFNLHGIWEEFSILQTNVIDREVEGMCVPERYLAVSWVRLDDLTEDVGSLVLVRDTTAVREQADSREEMVAMVAHELRTPLTALKNSLGIVAESGPVNAERFLSSAIRTVGRLGRLVDSLIDSSSARIDERPLTVEPHDVSAYLEEISTLFLEPMRRKGIDFVMQVAPSCARLTFDRDRIEQVLQNLLANSIKHVPAGGRISISVSPCDASPPRILPPVLMQHLPRVAFADLCVRDSGSSIPSNVADEINLGGESPGRPAKGAKGLGLLIAKRLARMHGGSLVIDEGTGEGNAVHLYLPVDRESAGVVQKYGSLELRFEGMLARGLTPAVMCLSKEQTGEWSEAVRSWRPAPAIDPPRGETPERAALLWPFSDVFALALAPRVHTVEGVRAGWASGPREGTVLGDLIVIALERMERSDLAPVMEGVDG